jgi:hypothetical protein
MALKRKWIYERYPVSSPALSVQAKCMLATVTFDATASDAASGTFTVEKLWGASDASVVAFSFLAMIFQ